MENPTAALTTCITPTKAFLYATHARYAWRLWEYNWTPRAAGNYHLMCRAADVEGNRQPLEPLWNPGGYHWNGMDRINFNIRA